jgi:ABC-2 type transport system permease protein
VSSFAGTGALVRLALRRDRIVAPVFVAVIVFMIASGASATVELYSDLASRIQAATVINTATSTLAMFGPIHDLTSIGALAVFKTGTMCVLAVAIFGARIVIRHTRAEEETGRLELLGAAVVGRRAPLTAGVIISLGATVITGLLSGLALYAIGLPGTGAALGAIAAQLSTSGRGAAGIATSAIGIAYLIRAVADASSGGSLAWLSWLSPLGWWQQVRPYAGDRAWPLALLLAFALALFAAAYAFTTRRDFGGSLLADRAGPAEGGRTLTGPLGLAWRLQRTSFVIWATTCAVVGAMIGGLAGSVGGFLDNPTMRDLFEKLGGAAVLSDTFMAVELGFLAVGASVFGLQSVHRARSEEVGGRADPTLATATTRVRWLGAHVVIGLAGSVALLAIAGATSGITSAGALDTPNQWGRVMVAALIQVPAVFVVIGIGVAGFGIAGRLSVAGWTALATFLILGEFGTLLGIPQAIINLSPYAHTPRLPGGTFAWSPVVWLVGIAVALVAVGLAAFRRRDLD